ncbi:response regulator [Vibrio ichthyoenteri ATCC 700023]|uniref:Response regulator n=1 Tax=Vibrio ichthyoenteri ATCC 700023 TaxID=870968 RepID=F9S1T5_9VIBR|nr:response regulator [Vibrio ichthyoenteri]EGU41295.1 response regulator [Vibrio ichthyoenteri ATCC 700023]
MNKYLILCVDDEREVLDSVIQDLDCFEQNFLLEAAESVAEAKEIIAESQQEGTQLALILCDHIMPEQTGINFLIELSSDSETNKARKLLLTGQAGLEDTVEAINHASLDFYLAKPWDGDQIRQVIKDQLTQFMIDNEPELMPWASVLNTEQIFNAIAENRLSFGE